MYEIWYDYVKGKYDEKAKLCYMNTDSFIVHEKTDYICVKIEAKFDTSNCQLDKPLTKEENEKVIGLMKYSLGGKLVTEFVGLRGKTYSDLRNGRF